MSIGQGKNAPWACAKEDMNPRTEEEVEAHRETAGVVAWRRARLRKAGFGIELAEELSRERDVDLHALIELVDRGCAPTAGRAHPGAPRPQRWGRLSATAVSLGRG
jgi:hypothetical protein